MAVLPDLNGIYPSPGSSERESTSPQPTSAAEDKPAASAAKPAAKRKRENRYKNAPPSVLSVSCCFPNRTSRAISNIPNVLRCTCRPSSDIRLAAPHFPHPPCAWETRQNCRLANMQLRKQRRRAQNRASQRAYRERKDQRIKDLETMLAESKQKNESLSQAYSVLHTEFLKLRSSQQHARSASHHHHQARHSIALPFDHSAAMAPPIDHHLVDGGMYAVFPEMPNYAL